MIKNVIFYAMSFAVCQFANASTFAVMCDSKIERSSKGCGIKLTGKIEYGDSERLRNIISKPLTPSWFYKTLILDSPGGDVQEAIKLASVVREAMLETTTVRNSDSAPPKGQSWKWSCVSACFLIWVAGTERFSMQGKSFGIGLHRPFFSDEAYRNNPAEIANAQQSVTIAIRDYLRREEIPERFIEKMLERSSREIYWLYESGDEFALNGRAAWFEEMMISRCAYDPAYDKNMGKAVAQMLENGKSPSQILSVKEVNAYFDWRRKFNSCSYQIRIRSQDSFQLPDIFQLPDLNFEHRVKK